MAIKQLKVENNTVLVTEELNGKWINADQSHILPLEKILRKVENLTLPKTCKKECIVFEKEFKVGVGSVKSFKDKDGDFVCTYEKETKAIPVEINEDIDFELNNPKDDKSQVNLWKTETNCPLIPLPFLKIKEEEKKMMENIKTLKIPQSSSVKEKPSRGVYDISSEKTICAESPKNSFSVPQITKIKHKQANYKFEKRKIERKEKDKPKKLVSMFKEFKMAKNAKKSQPPAMISFVLKSKWRPEERLDGDLIKSVFRYNKIHDLKNTLESNFYLKIEKDKKMEDFEFENLLKSVVER